ncbi:MAG: ABC transporter ATP-binding protein [Gemmobacter sp.]|nr:ABC transporter ATP-binding protein [Gemmobacter sp.]
MSALLSVSGLTAGYRPDLPIISDLSLTVAAGEMVTIIGPNGAGKSTLIKAIAGLLPISSGTVMLEQRSLVGLSPHLLSGFGMAYVPQSDNIFSSLTVDENLRLGALPLPRAKARAQIKAAYDRFPDLVKFKAARAGNLSGGQRQMLAVARALLTSPALVMLDEPSAGLAPKMVEEVFVHLTALVKSGVAVLMVEQNAKAAMRISDRTYVLAEGRNRLDGQSSKLLDDPEVAQIYLGNAGKKH